MLRRDATIIVKKYKSADAVSLENLSKYFYVLFVNLWTMFVGQLTKKRISARVNKYLHWRRHFELKSCLLFDCCQADRMFILLEPITHTFQSIITLQQKQYIKIFR